MPRPIAPVTNRVPAVFVLFWDHYTGGVHPPQGLKTASAQQLVQMLRNTAGLSMFKLSLNFKFGGYINIKYYITI